MARRRKPKLAVWKFASCDGCQLTLLDCEDELLALAGHVRIEHFLEAFFIRSDTNVVVLSALPIYPEGSPLSPEIMFETRGIVEGLCRDERVLLHGQVLPNVGPLDAVLRGIDRAFESYAHSRRSAGRPLKSLAYCVDAVLDAAAEKSEAMAGAITDRTRALRGTLKLAGGMTVCLYVFPPLLKHMKRVHPELDIRLTVATAARSVDEIRAGRVDAGLLTLPIDESDLITVPVLREELLLVTPPTHPLAKKKKIQASDLSGQPFVLFEQGSNTRRTIDEFFMSARIEPDIEDHRENKTRFAVIGREQPP